MQLKKNSKYDSKTDYRYTKTLIDSSELKKSVIKGLEEEGVFIGKISSTPYTLLSPTMVETKVEEKEALLLEAQYYKDSYTVSELTETVFKGDKVDIDILVSNGKEYKAYTINDKVNSKARTSKTIEQIDSEEFKKGNEVLIHSKSPISDKMTKKPSEINKQESKSPEPPQDDSKLEYIQSKALIEEAPLQEDTKVIITSEKMGVAHNLSLEDIFGAGNYKILTESDILVRYSLIQKIKQIPESLGIKTIGVFK